MVLQAGVMLPSAIHSEFADLRHRAGLTQHELGLRLCVSASLIAKWERSDQLPAPIVGLTTAVIAGDISAPIPSLAPADIRRIRLSVLRWSQEQLGAALGWSYAAIGHWERGGRKPPGWVYVYLHAVEQGWSMPIPNENEGRNSD